MHTGLLDRRLAWCTVIIHMGSSNQPPSHVLISPNLSWSIECLEIQLYFKPSDVPHSLATSSPLGIDNMLNLSRNGNFLMNI